MARKAVKGQQTKAETITVRVNPKTKYGLELLSRKQHRTLSDVVSWAIDQAICDTYQGLIVKETGENILNQAWEPHESDRLAKLAVLFPSLLDYDEELIWKLIVENEIFWINTGSISDRTHYIKKTGWPWVQEHLLFKILRDYWNEIKDSSKDLEVWEDTYHIISQAIP